MGSLSDVEKSVENIQHLLQQRNFYPVLKKIGQKSQTPSRFFARFFSTFHKEKPVEDSVECF
jgi:hypothetical protein